MAGPGLPVNMDTTYPDTGDASVKIHQQHHDMMHMIVDAIDKDSLPITPVMLAGIVANNQTGTSYTLTLADAGKVIELNNASPVSLLIPTDAAVPLPIGTVIQVWQQGAGQVAVSAVDSGTTTILSPSGVLTTGAQYGMVALRKRAANQWVLEASVGTSSQPSNICTNPTFVTSTLGDGISLSGYYVHNNSWNSSAPQTLSVCSFDSWYVVSTQSNLNATVMSYPNVHQDYDATHTFASYSTITSRYAATGPGFGIYNISYDIWINAYPGGSNSKELMIWTDFVGLTDPGNGSRVAQNVSIDGHVWDLWTANSNTYLAYLIVGAPSTSGNMNIKAFYADLLARGFMTTADTIQQIDYGIEIRSTNSVAARTDVTDFNIVLA